MRIIIIFLTLIIGQINPTFADDLFTKFDIGANVAINSISNFEDYIWVGTADGLKKINRFNGTFETFRTKEGLPGNWVSSVYCDKKGLVYTGVSGHLIVIYDDSLKVYIDEFLLSYTHRDLGDSVFYAKPVGITSIVSDKNNIIYMAANYNFSQGGTFLTFFGRVYKYDDEGWVKIHEIKFDPQITNSITCLAVNESNELSIGYDTIEPWGQKALAFDKEGGLWSSHPMDKYPPEDLADYRWVEYSLNGVSTHYDSTNSSLTSNVYSIIVDNNNTAWFGGKNLVSFNSSEWKVYSADTWSSTTKINTLTIDEDGYIWVGTQAHGLYRFDANNATAVESAQQSPTEITLSAPYPNPFNAQTTISFTLTKPSKVNLSIYSLTGQKVRELAADNYSAGKHTSVWDGKNGKGEIVSSGLYLARMESGGMSKVVRMAMVK